MTSVLCHSNRMTIRTHGARESNASSVAVKINTTVLEYPQLILWLLLYTLRLAYVNSMALSCRVELRGLYSLKAFNRASGSDDTEIWSPLVHVIVAMSTTLIISGL